MRATCCGRSATRSAQGKFVDEAPAVTILQARNYTGAFHTVYWFATDDPQAAKRAADELVLDDLPPVVGAEIAWAMAVVSGEAGQTAKAEANADAGYRSTTSCFDAPQMRFNIADAHLTALLLAGRVADAGEVAEEVQRQSADLPGEAQLLGSAVAGRAALGAGKLDTACRLLEQAALGLSAAGHGMGWGYRYNVVRVTALAMHGAADEAAAVLADLDEVRRPFRSLDYELSLARAWVSASQGAVSAAIDGCLSSAQRASAKGQFAAEVNCLQAAAQFGDRTGASRLAELESVVEGRRVGLVARFAAALRDRDARELALVSEGFEELGDLVAAVDSAAHAALAYRRHDQRGSALGCSARAAALAVRCGGAVTPALRHSAEPLPLTDREREVVMLLGQGLSNRAVAELLTLSVSTVENASSTGRWARPEPVAVRSSPHC